MSIPCSPELERGLLGCILSAPADATNELMSHYSAGAKLFWDQRNRMIFDAVATMVDESKPVDEVTLAEYLKARTEINAAGGLAFLNEAWAAATTPHNLKYYADQLNELHLSRELIGTGQKIAKLGEDRAGTAGLDEAEREILSISSQNRIGDDSSIKKAIKTVIERIQEQHAGRHKQVGLSTGLHDLDRLLNGLKPGQLIIIAARPSRGKTALAMQIAQYNALHGFAKAGIFSLEMSKEELVERMVANESGVNLGSVNDHTPAADFEKIKLATLKILGAGVRINERGGISVMALRASARRMVQRHHVSLLIVDYIQLMQGSSRENRTQEVSEISRGLKALAKELKIPVVALSQLNRMSETEGRKPRLSDLRESGSIEQDADAVIMIHSDDNAKEEAGQVKVKLLVQKNRNGRVGEVEVLFVPTITKFRSEAYASE